MRAIKTWAALAVLLCVSAASSADRVVLAPSGRITLPGDVSGLYVWRAAEKGGHGRLNVGWPQDDLGLELEAETWTLETGRVETLDAQYSVISEAFTNNLAPAVSVGVRDIPNRGPFGRAYFLSLSKSVRLTEKGEAILGTLRIHAGYGTHSVGGGFVGASVHTPFRLSLAAELYRRRFNASAELRVMGPLSAYACSLNGAVYAGLGLRISR